MHGAKNIKVLLTKVTSVPMVTLGTTTRKTCWNCCCLGIFPNVFNFII